ncbi:hypothetical protein ACLQ2D_21280 [Streptomyces sp. DT199]|uniref:hypothetical protein n=1 Tax=Streptomyces sp. DT199 TaxID=3393421 RepID=UPI003CE9E0DC
MTNTEEESRAEKESGIAAMAYDVALRGLQLQDTTVANQRLRASNLLSVSALGTSFAAAASRFHVSNLATPGKVLASLAIAVMVVIGILCLLILKPSYWDVGPSIRDILNPPPGDLNHVKANLARQLDAAYQENKSTIEKFALLYEASIVLLVIQIGLLVALAIFR